jgi:hypothetical protein
VEEVEVEVDHLGVFHLLCLESVLAWSVRSDNGTVPTTTTMMMASDVARRRMQQQEGQ